MVNQVVLAVGLGLVAGLVVVVLYLLLQYFRQRSSANNYKYTQLTSDPRLRSRTIINQDIPPFYIPQPVSIPQQQPANGEIQRTGSISKEEYRHGHAHLSATVHSVNVRRKAEDSGGIQLDAINTGTISPPSLTPKLPRTPRTPRKISHSQKQSSKENLSIPQHRKVAVHKKNTEINLGKLEFSLYYDQSFRLLQIYATRGIKITILESVHPPDILITASIILNSKQIWEQKTRVVKKTNNPQFNEKLEAYGITPGKLSESMLRFQLFDTQTNTIVGEVEYVLKDLLPNKLTTKTLPLIPVETDETECTDEEKIEDLSSELGELSISLCHNPTDQKLMVKVNCARGLQQISKDGRLNPFVKLELTFCGRKLSTRTTKTAHNTRTPNFSEMYVFDVNSDKLPQITLFFKVKHRGMMRDVPLGTVHLGYCVNVESEYKHWEQAMEKPHLEIAQWHTLQEYFVE